MKTKLSMSQDPWAAATRQVIAQVAYPLVDLGSQGSSGGDRLTRLPVLPRAREQPSVPGAARWPVVVAKWPLPESPNRTLAGRASWVNAVAIAPDGSSCATASHVRTVRIWRADGEPAEIQRAHTDWVRDVAIAPDGSWLASASSDATVRIWGNDGRPITILRHDGAVKAVAIAPDGSWLATASNDHSVRIWRADGRPITTLRGHAGRVRGIAIAPDGSWLASAASDHTIRIWSLGEPTACAAIVRLQSAINDVTFAAPDLVIACGGGKVYAFELSQRDHEAAADLGRVHPSGETGHAGCVGGRGR